jgi:hypothetical protein
MKSARKRAFGEHARDQRHLCAEAVLTAADDASDGELVTAYRVEDRAHAAAMNARAPGE